MTNRYPIPAGRHRIELVIQRSRFIATADYTSSVTEARDFVAEMRREFSDATHNVYAFAVGFGASVTHGMSDDGEPPGTAGRPALAVVQGSGLGDVCLVITRYFGGVKLGTGGLVKAYTEAAQTVLAEMPRTVKTERKTVAVTVPYGLYELCRRLVESCEGDILSEEFAVEVSLVINFRLDRLEAFTTALAEATSGQVEPRPVQDDGQRRGPI
ncbi:MAG: YigZ family protein [Anaerolineae bacterium]